MHVARYGYSSQREPHYAVHKVGAPPHNYDDDLVAFNADSQEVHTDQEQAIDGVN